MLPTIADDSTMSDPLESRIEANPRPGQTRRSARKILFASVHSIVDFSNGASVATLDVLQGLTPHGFECQAFCTAKLDLRDGGRLRTDDRRFARALSGPIRRSCGAEQPAGALHAPRIVPITFIRLESTRHAGRASRRCARSCTFFAKFLDVYRPDVMLTYGGDPITQGMIRSPSDARFPVVF